MKNKFINIARAYYENYKKNASQHTKGSMFDDGSSIYIGFFDVPIDLYKTSPKLTNSVDTNPDDDGFFSKYAVIISSINLPMRLFLAVHICLRYPTKLSLST